MKRTIKLLQALIDRYTNELPYLKKKCEVKRQKKIIADLNIGLDILKKEFSKVQK
jgi:hypothetical protein